MANYCDSWGIACKNMSLNDLTTLSASNDAALNAAQYIYSRDYAEKEVFVKCVNGKITAVELEGLKLQPYNFAAFVSSFAECFTSITLQGFHLKAAQKPFKKATNVILKNCKFTSKIRSLAKMFPKMRSFTLDGTALRGEFNSNYHLKALRTLTVIMSKWMCKRAPVRALSKLISQNPQIRSLTMMKYARWCHVRSAIKHLKRLDSIELEFSRSKQPFYKFSYPYDRFFIPDTMHLKTFGSSFRGYIA